MKNNKKIIYKRILLKLSGEIFRNIKNYDINLNKLNLVIKEIKKLVQLKIQIGIVIGGGNIFKGSILKTHGINHIISDQIGMLSTIINGLIILDSLQRSSINSKLMSSIKINTICDIYHWKKAIDILEKNIIVIFSGGTGNPFFTTDSAACLRGIEINADIILKATKVDGVYSCDPSKNKNAIFYKKLTYEDVLKNKLKIMDSTAFALARDHNLPIRIFNINKIGILDKILMGKSEGTLISN